VIEAQGRHFGDAKFAAIRAAGRARQYLALAVDRIGTLKPKIRMLFGNLPGSQLLCCGAAEGRIQGVSWSIAR